ncbi:ATP-binding protein [Pseudoalteromonas luteoviolacea]|uniref:ATP-binding protein n=1 Tax=Pseudoalteromonas luteoviolacea TaxID=43657 RepID=UPI001F16362A|nr:ATP-binding protein [Pseudoalteromonas luteoviolacea]MCF6441225.1 ATP-binding protein [Pseudoalteromonas luteoviolacea]
MKKIFVPLLLTCILSTNTALASIDIDELKQLEKQGKYQIALDLIEPWRLENLSQDKALEVLLIQAEIYRKQGLFEKAISTLNHIEQNHYLDTQLIRTINNEKGINYRRMSRLEEAEEHYYKALKAAQELNDKTLIGLAYSNLGTLSDHRSELAQAMQFQLKAQSYLKDSNNHSIKASNFYNLGDISVRLDDYDQAEIFFRWALGEDKKDGNIVAIADSALRLSQVSFKKNNHKVAIDNIYDALKYLKQTNANESLSRAYHMLASSYIKLEQGDAALINAHLSLDFAKKAQSQIQMIYAHISVSQAYLYLKQPHIANSYIQELQKLINSEHHSPLSIYFHEVSADLAHQNGDLELAYKHISQAFNFNKAIGEEFNNQKAEAYRNSISSLVQRQQLEVSEKEKALAQSELKHTKLMQKSWLIAGLSALFICSLLTYIYFIKHRSANLAAKLYQQNLKQKEKMLADISHELRTPLSVLKLHIEALEHGLFEDNKKAYSKINEKISQLNSLITDVYQLSQAENNAIALNQQIQCVQTLSQNYSYDIKRMTENHALTFSSEISIPEGSTINIDKPKLDRVVDNLCKNTCLYTDSPGKVVFKMYQDKHHLNIQIEDSSPTVTDEELPKLFERLYRVESSRSRATGGSGLGLSICKSLVELMSGTIDIKRSNLGGLDISIALPLK